jgi:hypothetical protein
MSYAAYDSFTNTHDSLSHKNHILYAQIVLAHGKVFQQRLAIHVLSDLLVYFDADHDCFSIVVRGLARRSNRLGRSLDSRFRLRVTFYSVLGPVLLRSRVSGPLVLSSAEDDWHPLVSPCLLL